MHKDLRKIVKELERQGFTVEATSKGHLRVTKAGVLITTISGTPSDRRAIPNAIAAARRGGFIWPPRR